MENIVEIKKFKNEWIIKESIEDIFEFGNFKKTECPDLQNKTTGIEITSANPREIYFNGNFDDIEKRKEVANLLSNDEHFEKLISAFNRKLEKLNSISASYKNLPIYGLFIETCLDLKNISKEKINILLNTQNSFKRKYTFLLIGSLINDKIYFLNLSTGIYMTKDWNREKYKKIIEEKLN